MTKMLDVPEIDEAIPEGVSIEICDTAEERISTINSLFNQIPGLNILKISILPNQSINVLPTKDPGLSPSEDADTLPNGEVSVSLTKKKEKTFIIGRYSDYFSPSILKPTTKLLLAIAAKYGYENAHILTINNGSISPKSIVTSPIHEFKGTWEFLTFMRDFPKTEGLTLTTCLDQGVPQGFIDVVAKRGITFEVFHKANELDIPISQLERFTDKYFIPTKMSTLQRVKFINGLDSR